MCELVYLGSVEVSGPGSEAVVRETVEQLKTLGLSTMNIVTFKASMNGITLMDNINGWAVIDYYPNKEWIIVVNKLHVCECIYSASAHTLYSLLN